MDADRFDALSRVLSSAPNRRSVAGAIVALVLGALTGHGRVIAQASCPNGTARCGGPGGLPTAE